MYTVEASEGQNYSRELPMHLLNMFVNCNIRCIGFMLPVCLVYCDIYSMDIMIHRLQLVLPSPTVVISCVCKTHSSLNILLDG